MQIIQNPEIFLHHSNECIKGSKKLHNKEPSLTLFFELPKLS